MQAPTDKTPSRRYCPAQPPSVLTWLGRLFGLTTPAYRGASQPTHSTIGNVPDYRPPRPKAPPAPCNGGNASQQEQAPIEQRGEDGVPLTQPVLLEGPVTIVIGTRE
jgi:hypothetical protein